MNRKIVSGMMLTLLLIGMLMLAFNVQPVKADGTIYIRPDGSIDPPTAPIERDGDNYIFTDNIYGSIVVERDNIVVDGARYTVQGTGSETGISLSRRINVTIRNMEIKAFDIGIYFDNSSKNCISGNYITENNGGIYLYGSNSPPETESCYNSIIGNNITENGGGILLEEAKFNNISRNNITANHGNVDYPLRPGGIYIFLNSLGNIVSGNNIINNERSGIYFHYCTALAPKWINVICGNNIINNSAGIQTYHGVGVDIFENNIKNNNVGLDLKPGIVTAYHNNFINNTQQVDSGGSTNNWDDGYPSGGNYWSDYNGIDLYSGSGQNETSSDGIGDTAYTVDENNQDNYPLMGPFTSFSVTWEGVTYHVDTVSNSTVSDFYFNQPDKLISFNVTGPDGTVGFCRVTIPKSLLKAEPSETWKVTIDGAPPLSLATTENVNHTYLYFTYTHTTHKVQITVIKEEAVLIGRGWGWMRIATKEYVHGPAELYEIEDEQIKLVITYDGEEYSRTWNIIRHKEYKNHELYFCFSQEHGPLNVGLHHARWKFWWAVGKDTIAFGHPRFGRLGLMLI